MKQLEFQVKNQIIERIDDFKAVSDSLNYLKCNFTFSEEWSDLTKTAVFISSSDEAFNVILINDECMIPWEVIKAPFFRVSVFGGDRITTNVVTVNVDKSGYIKGETPKAPTPDVYEQILNSAKPPYIGDNGNWYVWDIEDKIFVDTKVKAKGDPPQKGIDYFTEEDIKSLKIDEKDAKAVAEAKRYVDSCYDILWSDFESNINNKADKTSLVIVNESTYNFEFADLYNKIVRAKTMESISFNVEASEYSNLYEAELCFDSGETPTRIDYIVPENPEQIQVINWVGVDCANTSYVNSAGETVPISVFSPSANKHYEISFQYNGTQLIAWVGGFTPAGGNVVSA